MPRVVAYDDVKGGVEHHNLDGGAERWRTYFMRPKVNGIPRDPLAFLAQGSPHRVIGTHFHRVDQFQVVVKGGGSIGRHQLEPGTVHFARANTPYGPLVGGDEGVGFLTLRSMGDPTGQHHFPKAKEELRNIPNREPWQVTEKALFAGAGDVFMRELATIKDDRGLAAYALRLAPCAKASAPDPSQSDGQHIVITRGSLRYQGKDHKAITIAFVKPDEMALELEAGPEGLEALVLNYPRQREGAPSVAVKPGEERRFRVWQCALCAFSYDEAAGMPAEGIPPGTRWEDVPDTWTCPDCAAGKADFEMFVID